MDNKSTQNVQETFLNTIRKEKSRIMIYLISGVKLAGRIRSFDKHTVLLENKGDERLVYKHTISAVTSDRAPSRTNPHPILENTSSKTTPLQAPHKPIA